MIETVVKVDGMMCGMCESHVNDCIRQNFNVKKVNSSHVKGETVILSEDELDSQKLESVVNATGYTVREITVGEAEKKSGLFGHFGHKG